MIKIKRSCTNAISTKVNGKSFDIIEELFNGMICGIEILVNNECLKQEHINDFIDDFAQQVKDTINK